MSVLSLYIKTARIIFDVNPEQDASWAHMYGPLICLRRYLSCCVCEKLLVIPMKSTIGCRHFMCKSCVGGKLKKEGTCSQCADSSKFVEDKQMRIILQCFKKMCSYICCCGFYRNVDRSDMSVPKTRFYDTVDEGANYSDETYSHTSSSNIPDNKYILIADGGSTPRSIQRAVYRLKVKNRALRSLRIQRRTIKTSLSHRLARHRLAEDDDNSVQEISSTEGNEYIEEKETSHMSYIDSGESSDSSSFMEECFPSFRKRSYCRCGLITHNPGELACCEQRCPCYIAGRACVNCLCRGCRNPQKVVVISSHPLLPDGEHNLSPENLKDFGGSSNSFDETSPNDSSDEYINELRTESM